MYKMDKSQLKIIFMGTPDFSVASLDILVKNNWNVVGVVTSPDKPAGRGLEMHQSAVKKYALEKGLNILQPEKLKSDEFINQLKALNADLQIVVAFRMLPETVWQMPRSGTFNLHASLLPQYRGAAPINWAVINGETESGVTTFFLKHEIDTGKIIYREIVNISENETAGELHDKLMAVGAELVLKTVEAISNGTYTETDQQQFIKPGEILKHAPKIFKDDCRIDWKRSVNEVHNFIRGLSPHPGAFTAFISPEGKQYPVKLFKTTKEADLPKTGISTDSKTFLKIAAKDGYVCVHELQLAGKKRMTTSELLRGFPMTNEWKAL